MSTFTRVYSDRLITDYWDRDYPDCRRLIVDSRAELQRTGCDIYLLIERLKMLSKHPAVVAVIQVDMLTADPGYFIFYFRPSKVPDDSEAKFILCGEVPLGRGI